MDNFKVVSDATFGSTALSCGSGDVGSGRMGEI